MTASGNVGIGTASPTRKLEVSSTFGGGATGGIRVRTTDDGDAARESRVTFADQNDDTIATVGFSGYGNDFAIVPGTDVTRRILLAPAGGNVGINQTTPTSMLHIGSSTANADSAVLRVEDADGNCYFNPESTDTPWTCTSDLRLKENIKDAAPVMPYLLGIPIKDFTVIASGDNKTGVIAQELLEKYPELVHMDADGYYMVDGMNNWKLVKAIQEQQSQIEQLKQEIEELKNK